MKSQIISLIVDASESAAPFWKETAQTVADLIKMLPQDAVEGIYLLGSAVRWTSAQWHEALPFPVAARKGGSFITPICTGWQQLHFDPTAAVIIGAGEVFDLLDWVEKGEEWLLIRTDEDSLQAAQGRVREFQAAELEQVVVLLQAGTGVFQPPRVPYLTGSVAQQWRVDRAGFPMVWIPPLKAYVHLFPITKAQFEVFLTQAELPDIGDHWYQQLLSYNPRLSISSINFNNYERLCITGLLPEELQAYAAWQGPSFRCLSMQEWQCAAKWISQQSISVPPADIENNMSLMARRTWAALLSVLEPRTLCELSLMFGGVVEWVDGPNNIFLGMGRPRQRFQPGLAKSPWLPTSPPRRAKIWGGRLMVTA